MKASNFAYARPRDVGSALKLANDASLSVKIMAGSQSLGPMLNLRLVQPDLVVDIAGIDELRGAEARGDELLLGSCVTHADIEDGRVPDLTRGALPSVARNIAFRAVRTRGTIGGSLTHADPSADWISLLTALGARVTLRSEADERTIAVADYMLGALEADLRPGEILVSVAVPRLGHGARWGFHKTSRKVGEFAHAIGAFLIDPERKITRAVIGATDRRPFLMEEAGEVLNDGTPETFDAAAAERFAEREGMRDALERRTHVAVLRRSVEQAADR